MACDLDNLARLRVAATTGRLPPDLADWLLERLERTISRPDRVRRRDQLLRSARFYVIGGPKRAAESIELAIDAISAGDLEVLGKLPGGFRELVQQALEVDRQCPRSARHLLRILR